MEAFSGDVDCLIFTRDRPAQLDLLLRSIGRHAAHVYRTVTVLCDGTTTDFRTGYFQVWRPVRDRLFWEWERGDFEEKVRWWLERAGRLISFLCDDDVFFADAKIEDVPWSFRGGDYDYPFSLDGNVYQTVDIVNLLDGLEFRNPTELEWFGHEHRRRLPFTEVKHADHPCLVGWALNRVADLGYMPNAGVDVAGLNDRFLAGERLAPPTVVGNPGTHIFNQAVFT